MNSCFMSKVFQRCQKNESRFNNKHLIVCFIKTPICVNVAHHFQGMWEVKKFIHKIFNILIAQGHTCKDLPKYLIVGWKFFIPTGKAVVQRQLQRTFRLNSKTNLLQEILAPSVLHLTFSWYFNSFRKV